MKIEQQFTACDAYQTHKTTGKASAQRVRIMDYIEARAGMDFSIGEIAKALTMEKSTARARINELLNQFGESCTFKVYYLAKAA